MYFKNSQHRERSGVKWREGKGREDQLGKRGGNEFPRKRSIGVISDEKWRLGRNRECFNDWEIKSKQSQVTICSNSITRVFFFFYLMQRGIHIRLVVLKSVSWYSNSSHGIQIHLVVFKPISWYSNSSRGIQIRLVVFKSVSWYSNPSRGIQIHLVVFKSVSWYSNPSRCIQIRLVVFKFVSWCSNSSLWYSNSSGM